MGYSPWGHKELDTTEQLITSNLFTHLSNHINPSITSLSIISLPIYPASIYLSIIYLNAIKSFMERTGKNLGDPGWMRTKKGSPPPLTLSIAHMLSSKWALFTPQAAPFSEGSLDRESPSNPPGQRAWSSRMRLGCLLSWLLLADGCAASKHPRECTLSSSPASLESLPSATTSRTRSQALSLGRTLVQVTLPPASPAKQPPMDRASAGPSPAPTPRFSSCQVSSLHLHPPPRSPLSPTKPSTLPLPALGGPVSPTPSLLVSKKKRNSFSNWNSLRMELKDMLRSVKKNKA